MYNVQLLNQDDPNWPRRKKSSLVPGSYGVPIQYRRRPTIEEIAVPEPAMVSVPRAARIQPADMWPRRRKSDLLIYYQTRKM